MERKNERLPIFTERFRELQGDRSNTEFAEFLEISRQTVGFYYNGDRVPDALTLIKIAEKCNISTDWLLGLSEESATDIDVQRICRYTGLTQQSVERLNLISHSNKTPNTVLDFLNKILSPKIITDLQKSLWRAAVSEICNAKSYRDALSVDEFYELDESARSEYIDRIRQQRMEREENIDKQFLLFLEKGQDINSTIEISVLETSYLYAHRALVVLEEVVYEAISESLDTVIKLDHEE